MFIELKLRTTPRFGIKQRHAHTTHSIRSVCRHHAAGWLPARPIHRKRAAESAPHVSGFNAGGCPGSLVGDETSFQ
jgi:hypothetical protein